ncbi:MAG: DUF2974 domain-containing protein [Ruminococcus sp.]|nr:DUF2974 domain-containing protein [Ruminococcus sp.]
MANVFDYLEWRGDLTMQNDTFNDIDALILSRLSYFPFDGIVSENIDDKISIKNASEIFFRSDENNDKVLWKGDTELLKHTAESERFKNMELSGYVNLVEQEKQMQFSAVIVEVTKDRHFISFRGTDNTVVGWQEDFNMYYMFPLPSQKMAVDYLMKASKVLDGSFIMGGHSKGGNLAVYAAAFSPEDLQKRIIGVYNHDGPGFDSKSIEESGFKAVKDKIHTYVPQSSIFGMMFEHQEDYTIVKSSEKGFLQHDIYSWEVQRTELVHLNRMTSTSVFFDHTITDFVADLSVEQRKDFIEGIFSLLENTEDKTFNEIVENWKANSSAILKALKNMDSKTRSLIISTLLNFIKCAKNNFSDINPLSKENRKSKKKYKDKR